MPASSAMRCAFVLTLSGCAFSRFAAAQIASCPAGLTGATCRKHGAPKAMRAVSMVQVGRTNAKATTCACASAEAATGNDPCGPCELGYCTAAADPHFTSFDGFNGNYRDAMFNGNKAYRLVKTDTMEIQGLAQGNGGWVGGFAVGGDFLKGHSLVMIMRGTRKINKMSHADVLLDGQPILSEKNSQEHIPGVLDANRHELSQEEISDAVMKDLPEFQQNKNEQATDYMKIGNMKGDHYHFKLPEHVEIFADDRYLLIKMPKHPNMRGWCGNFNDVPDDDYNRKWSDEQKAAAGQDLFDAQDSSSLFKGEDVTSLGQKKEEQADKDTEGTGHVEAPDEEAGPCGSSPEKVAKARKVCNIISQPDKREECIYDVCKTGDTNVWKVYLDAEIEEVMNARGIPVFMGHGKCLDSEKRPYTTLTATGVETAEGCRGALQDLSPVEGVRGAQLGSGACQILVDAKHGDIATYNKVSDGPGELIVENTDGTESYTCWKLN